MIYLVRHAHSGKRVHWKGDDRKRPLTGQGWRQSRGVALRLSTEASVSAIYTSPHVRCLETVLPLGDILGLEVQTLKALREGRGRDEIMGRLADFEPGTVLCSHGDVIGAVIRKLVAGGVEVKGKKALRNGKPIWLKASTWELTRSPKGKVKTARYVPPPFG
ncbi:histidine phosphatase family protein [bacterium]|nr:histidine phosphatase family protein [bacterium]